ncbi:MAG TPA: UBP-type zinc finger domain-containing protein [Archangium sp.]|nr:UBP-type zinc finger domain-containing protein [Archangium sp.]
MQAPEPLQELVVVFGVAGPVGCCVASFGRHAMKHDEATGHPLMRSFEPGEHWGWCYDGWGPRTLARSLDPARLD